jgi:carboxyl-terminal processing protease
MIFSVGKAARCAVLALVAVAAGCSGGGGDGGGGAGPPAPPAPPASGWVAGSFLPAASFAGKCINPRSGTNPQTGQAYNEIVGTALDENNWLRSWSNDLYLWYNEIVDRDPGLYATPAYFDNLKTTARTSSGAAKDRFHFTYPTSEWLTLVQSGEQVGYGAVWTVKGDTNPPEVLVAYTEPSSPAASNDLVRGEMVVAVDGVSVNALTSAAVWNAFFDAVYPSADGETHSFTLLNPRNGRQRTVPMTATAVTTVPVRNVQTIDTSTGRVGYILFNDHLPIAEPQLIDAFALLASEGATDLVLDLRYNGGGLLAIASEVAYMIAGAVPTAGQAFEQLQFNDKHRSTNPFTGGALTPVPFLTTSSTGQPLPTLNLQRVFVLTGSMTCSASESIINGLRGVNVEVIQIGSTTCGKPYGFFPEDNCGTTYFTIQFQGVNAAGFGSYGDGFTPLNTPSAGAERLPGCSVHDDLSHELGDPFELRLHAALEYRRTQGQCPLTPSGLGPTDEPGFTKPVYGANGEATDGTVVKPSTLTNRWLDGL